MVLRSFYRRRCPLFLVLSTRHPVQLRSCPIQELRSAFRADEAATERAEIGRLRAGGADRVRTGGLITGPHVCCADGRMHSPFRKPPPETQRLAMVAPSQARTMRHLMPEP